MLAMWLETAIVYWVYIGIMEKKMETTVVCWGYMAIMVGFFTSMHSCFPAPGKPVVIVPITSAHMEG